ncbi:MAG: glycosyltransferase family 2 protein [Clostridium sp.]
MNRKISIIVPAYNAEKYIEKNLKSIIDQNYENYEVIVVNDGSTDRTREIVEEYIAKFFREKGKIINIENGGLANARNIGIENSSGEFFCNLDSDDYLDEGIFNKINLIEEDYDICYYGWKDILEDGHKINSLYNESFEFINNISGLEAAKLKLNKKIWICQGNAIYRTKMIKENNILNLKGFNQGEDFYFIVRALLHAKKVCCVEENAFNCLVRENSMMHSKFNKTHLQVLDLIKKLKNDIQEYTFLENEKENIEKLLEIEYLRSSLGIAKKIIDSNQMKDIKKIKEKLDENICLDKSKYENSNIESTQIKIEKNIFAMNKYVYIIFVKLFRYIKK